MLPAKRRQCILEHILANGSGDTEALAKRFGVSTMTIRRDLRVLEETRHVRVTHGGALAGGFSPHDIPYDNKTATNLEAKRAIARLAVDMVEDNACILLDAGTTTLELAKLLVSRTLTVITTDLQIALLLCASPSLTVHTTGGPVDYLTKAHIGEPAQNYLREVRASLAFISTNVWEPESGVTSASMHKQQIKRQMIRSARETVLLADSGKFGRFSPWRVADLDEFAAIITDRGLGAQERERVALAGGQLRIA